MQSVQTPGLMRDAGTLAKPGKVGRSLTEAGTSHGGVIELEPALDIEGGEGAYGLSGLLAACGWFVTGRIQSLFGAMVDRRHSYDLGVTLAGCAPLLALTPPHREAG